MREVMGDLVIQMGEMVGSRRRRREASGGGTVTPDTLMLDIMSEVEEKKERSRRVSGDTLERTRRVSGAEAERRRRAPAVAEEPTMMTESKSLDAVLAEEEDEMDLLGELETKVKVEVAESPSRQRKVSHRKVIIHDDGEICNTTYNQVCPYGHEDPDTHNPPMFHEMGGGSLPPGLIAAMGRMGGMGGMMGGEGMNPELMMRMAAMGGGGMEGMMGGMGGDAMGNPAAMMMQMAAMGAMAGGGGGMEGMMAGGGGMAAMMAAMGGGGEGGGLMANPEMMMRMAAMGGLGGGGMEGMMAAMAGAGEGGEGGEGAEMMMRQYMAVMQQAMGMGMNGTSSRHFHPPSWGLGTMSFPVLSSVLLCHPS